jgi:hypothetical protein
MLSVEHHGGARVLSFVKSGHGGLRIIKRVQTLCDGAVAAGCWRAK